MEIEESGTKYNRFSLKGNYANSNQSLHRSLLFVRLVFIIKLSSIRKKRRVEKMRELALSYTKTQSINNEYCDTGLRTDKTMKWNGNLRL